MGLKKVSPARTLTTSNTLETFDVRGKRTKIAAFVVARVKSEH